METQPQPDRRLALVVANARYDDDGLQALASPAQDAVALTRVLGDAERGGFQVANIVDAGSSQVIEAVEEFLSEVERTDLVLLYFSCHGLKDEQGRLYFASRNTVRNRLRSTAVSAAVVNDLLLGSRSRRKVLLLDCCYGGAFAKGMQVKSDPAVHTAEQFDARGLVVLTASDSTQYAFDGDVLRGSATPSRFTAVLVDGLSSGAADVDRDGLVTVDDAYDYVRRRLADDGVPQSPRKWEFDVAGHIVLARTNAVGKTALGEPIPSHAAAPARLDASREAAQTRVREWRWWFGFLAVLLGCCLTTFLIVTWFTGVYSHFVKSEYIPSLGDVHASSVALAAAWAAAYGWVGRRSQAWEPLVSVYRDLLGWTGPRRRASGLVSAVPINMVFVAAASLVAGAVGYALTGSELRDTLYRPVFVVLAIAGLLRYLAAERAV